jgi:PhnB protein
MSDIRLEVYLFFHGQAKEAMEFYKGVFGGELTTQTYKDVNMAGDHPDWLMHASLEGGAVKLMASDTEQASDKSAKVSLSIGGTDEAGMRDIFEKLKEGANVTRDLQKEFWGDIYGQLIDKYGVDWMINIAQPGSMTDKS